MNRQPQSDRLSTSAAGVISAAPPAALARKGLQKLNDDLHRAPEDIKKDREGFSKSYDQTFGSGSFTIGVDGSDSVSYSGDMTNSDPAYFSSPDGDNDSQKKALDMYRAVVENNLEAIADRYEEQYQKSVDFHQSLYQYNNPLYSPQHFGAQPVYDKNVGFDLNDTYTQTFIATATVHNGEDGKAAWVDNGKECLIADKGQGEKIILAKQQMELGSARIDYTKGILPLTSGLGNVGQGTDLMFATNSKIDFIGAAPSATVQGDPVVQKFMATVPSAPTSQGSDLQVATEAMSKDPAFEQGFKPKNLDAAPVPLKPAAPALAFNV